MLSLTPVDMLYAHEKRESVCVKREDVDGVKGGLSKVRFKKMEVFYLCWTTALQARRRILEPHSENWRNKTQTEMRDALKHPTVVTGYLEGNASSLI